MDGYLFDPHTHTAETSKCGHLPAAEVVDRYMRHGFSGLVVTDHLHPEYLSRIDTDHDWNKVIDHYLSGYRASKQRGDEVGFCSARNCDFPKMTTTTWCTALMRRGCDPTPTFAA